MRLLAVVSSSLALCMTTVPASGPRAQGPGIPNQAFPQNELFTIISSFGTNSYGHHFLHDGYVASLRSGNGVEFYDVSDPYSPALVSSYTGSANGMDLSEPHTYIQTDAWDGRHVILARGPGGLGGTGFVISDWTDVLNPVLESTYDLPGSPGGYVSGTFWIAAQAPYVYAPFGSLGLAILDCRDPKNPVLVDLVPKSKLGGFNAVLAFAIGNVLILTNSDGGPGFARLDISVPWDPILLDSNPNTPIPYGASVNGGKLIVPAVSGPVSCSCGQAGSFHMHDIFSPGFGEIGSGTGLPARGGSAILQDDFVHVAASSAYRKFEISNPASPLAVGNTAQPISGGDWDWVSPMGNFAILSDDQGQGSHIIPHQAAMDLTPPQVTMISPTDGATDQAMTTRVGITTSDMIDMESIDATSFIVRPLGGQAISGSYTNQQGILNFFPDSTLLPSTTYEVVIPAGGMKDWAGNGIVGFTSQFTTDNGSGVLGVVVQEGAPAQVDTAVNLNVQQTVGVGPYTFSWDFGDGTPPTPFSSSPQANHTYTRGGHFNVVVTIDNGTSRTTDSYLQTIHYPIHQNPAAHSSTIAIHEPLLRMMCVNPDQDTVTRINTLALINVNEIPVGDHPRTVAYDATGAAWVACQDDATIHVIHPISQAKQAVIQLPPGSAPYGIAHSPDGSALYVTLQGTGEVAKLDPVLREVVARTYVGPDPRGIAITPDSQRIFVTRHRSSSRPLALGGANPGSGSTLLPASEERRSFGSGSRTDVTEAGGEPFAEVYEISASTFLYVRTIPLAMDEGPDLEDSGRGLPNYLGSPTVSPDNRRLFVPSKKDNIQRGVFRDGNAINFESTVRTIVSQIDLTTSREDLAARVDLNDRDMACATVFSPLSDYAFLAVQGSNSIEVHDAFDRSTVAEIVDTGMAPQGMVLSSDGRLFVHNFMSRSVTVYDVAPILDSSTFLVGQLADISTVTTETLAPDVLLGKQIFYNADDDRMNEDGYLSCASCHLDGGQDGRVWDFTQRGEGLRNTISLHGRSGLGHGRVHWTANFDEIQDFENDIREAFGGDGFLTNQQFQNTADPLGSPKTGLSTELDALAAYISSLTTFGRSPNREPNGDLTPAGVRGRLVFQQMNCASCHSGPNFADNQTHNVGTIRASSGQAVGGPLTGFDTPTLRGLWDTAPYLHDGSAETLMEVLTARNPLGLHGGATRQLSLQDRRDLVAYLLQIDDLEPAPQ